MSQLATFTSVETTRFGTVTVEPDQILAFPDGLVGLDGHHYALLPAGRGPLRWLQSLQDPALALPVADPRAFFPELELRLEPEALERIGVAAAALDGLLVTVRAAPRAQDCTANTRAPIVLVADGDGPRRAWQVLNRGAGAQLRAPLFPGG